VNFKVGIFVLFEYSYHEIWKSEIKRDVLAYKNSMRGASNQIK